MSFTVLTGFQYFTEEISSLFESVLFSQVVLGKDKPIYFDVDNQIFASRRLLSWVEG